jgi:DNA-binding FadR family transcriptional regulator
MEIIRETNLSEALARRLLSLSSLGHVELGGKLSSENQLRKMLGVSWNAVRGWGGNMMETR